MRPTKILVVDDEAMARRGLVDLLERSNHGNLEILEAENGHEALQVVGEFKPDVVFLDVNMPGLSGFDVLFQLHERPLQVVFQTAHSEFAVKAFDANACDYLVKPFSDA